MIRPHISSKTAVWLLLSLLSLLSLLASCTNIFAPEQREPEGRALTPTKLQTSPDSVLFNFESALNHKDIEVYKRCLSRDFQFFDPHLPATDPNCLYGYDDEIAIIGNMFGIEQLEIQWKFGNLRHTGEDGSEDNIEGMEVQNIEAYFQVTVFDGAITQVASGTQKYKFAQESKDHWVIVENRDESIAPEGL